MNSSTSGDVGSLPRLPTFFNLACIFSLNDIQSVIPMLCDGPECMLFIFATRLSDAGERVELSYVQSGDNQCSARVCTCVLQCEKLIVGSQQPLLALVAKSPHTIFLHQPPTSDAIIVLCLPTPTVPRVAKAPTRHSNVLSAYLPIAYAIFSFR